MKKNLIIYLKFFGLILLITFMFAFTEKRNQQRKIHQVQVEFIEEQNPYINELAVNKLLIQNPEQVTNVGKEILVLNKVEGALDAHKMVEDSDVYLTVNGKLRARIKQRTPIARVNAITPFYVDFTGEMMPLSTNYSAHVPLVNNVSEQEISEVYPLLRKIQKDEFLKKHVVSVSRGINGNYELDLRVYNFKVLFGKIEEIENKVKNFKAFYQKAFKDHTLNTYKKVSLQFDNQIVCTLK